MKYQKFERLYLVLPKHNTKAREKQMSIPRGEILDTLTLYREEITPEIAAQMLKHGNPGNRKISKSTVMAYANDMSKGDWDANAVTPIVFDSTGLLVEGHHRLNAVIVANTPIITYVAENADPSFTYNLDLVRSINNILQMNGVSDVSTNATALIRTIGNICFGVQKVSLGEIKKAYMTDGDGIVAITRAACKGSTKPLIKGASFTAAMYCAYKSGVSLDMLEEFAQIVNSGIPNSASQRAPLVFRNQILSGGASASSGTRMDRKICFLCTQEAIRDFVNGVARTKSYSGKTATYYTEFVDAFRAGTLYGGKS